jgi:hypothetical protein
MLPSKALGMAPRATKGSANNGKAGDSNMGRFMTTAHSDKRQARPPTDHFKKLLKEAYPNHAYLIMMNSFMISRSPT